MRRSTLDNKIIEKNGRRYRVEQFDTDGKKQIAQDGIPVEYAYKAGQFVVTTDGPQPANHYHVLVFDDMQAFAPYDVVEGQPTPQEDAQSLGGHPHDDNEADLAKAAAESAKNAGEPETLIFPDEESFAEFHAAMTNEGAPPVDNEHVAPGAEQFTQEVIDLNKGPTVTVPASTPATTNPQ
jgi:hypothetical protein